MNFYRDRCRKRLQMSLKSRMGDKIVIVLGVVLLVVVVVGPWAGYQHCTVKTVKGARVNKMVDKKDSNKKERYLILTSKGEFENTDAFWHFKWRSSTLQNKIKVGKCYDFKTYGWRWGFRSWYPNVVGYKEVKCPESKKK